MGSFFSKINTVKSKYFIILASFIVLGFSALGFFKVQAASVADPIPTDLQIGDVSGFAWMGTEIATPGQSEGGGGWINFNCKSDQCYDLNGDGTLSVPETWGVTIDLDHNGTDGGFRGQAWSSNYGWLNFRGNQVSSCWQDNPGVTYDGVARADVNGGSGVVDVTGWGKFTAGTDSDDGWDGCVSFSGANHGVKLDMTTGVLSGWAWGGPVVGWISFQNPECRFCNTNVTLSGVPQMTFWANPMTLLPGMTGSDLKWTSSSSNGNYIKSCENYTNTSGYGHWNSSLPNTPPNVVAISTLAGNLPAGSHPAPEILQTTTYSLTCKDSYDNVLPTKYTTVTVWTEGCMDPLAPNYDPEADIDDGSCVGAGSTAVALNVITNGNPNNTLPEGSSNPVDYQVSPRWIFTNRNQIAPNSCQQSFKDENNQIQSVVGWTGSQLANPPYPGNDPFNSPNGSFTTTNIASYADSAPAGSIFTFTITCQDLNGNPVSASDTVIIAAAPADPVPSLQIFAENPTLIIGSGNYNEDLYWISNNPSALHNCSASFKRNNLTETLTGWTNVSSIPDPELSVAQFSPLYTAHQSAFNTKAGNVTAPLTFWFKITCEDSLHGNSLVTAQTSVIMANPIISTEPPFLDLTIKIPDSDGAGHTEQIPAAGWDNSVHVADPFTLKWSAQNVQNCTARSEQYVGSNPSPVSVNADWNGQSIPDDGDPSDPINVEKSFSILGSSIKNTKFFIDCTPDNTANYGSATMTAEVCMSITGQPFPQCSVVGPAKVPAYKEI